MSFLAYFYFVITFNSITCNRIYVIIAIFMWSLYIYFKLHSIFVYFFIAQLLLPICGQIQRKKTQLQRKYIIKGLFCMSVAITCWSYERYLYANHLCSNDATNYNYYLHSYWHIGAALAHYYYMLANDYYFVLVSNY